MNNLYKKLNRESDHIRLTADEKRAIKARVFGAPSPVTAVRSPYVFVATHRWITALAALVLVVFAGSSTAFAAQGALPGQPLYALKTQVLEPVQVALAPTPAAKAAVHVALAQKRVEEAETLAQQGALTASTSAQLAANFESNAQSAETIATQIATSDPAVAVQIQTQLSASSAVGGAVLAALGNDNNGNSRDKGDADALAVQVSAHGNRQHDDGNNNGGASSTADVALASATAPKAASIRTFAAATTSDEASSTQEPQAETASVNLQSENTADKLEQNAQDALDAARAGFAAASSTLDASTTVAVQTSLTGIDGLISDGSTALGDSLYDTAVKDFTDALGRALRLEALLKAQQTFDNNSIVPLFNLNLHDQGGDSGN